MTLESWGVRNFKSIKTCDIALADINLVVGANSIGKSSLIQSIVSTSQSIDSGIPFSDFNFYGDDLDIGNNSSFFGSSDVPINIRWEEERDNSGGVFALDNKTGFDLEVQKLRSDTIILTKFEATIYSRAYGVRYLLERAADGSGDIYLFLENSHKKIPLIKGASVFGKEVLNIISHRGGTQVANWFSALTLLSLASPKWETQERQKATKDKNFGEIWHRFLRILEEMGRGEVSEVAERNRNLATRILKFSRQSISEMEDGTWAHLRASIIDLQDDELQQVLDEIALASRLEDFTKASRGRHVVLEELLFALSIDEWGSGIFYLGPLRALSPRQQVNRNSPGSGTPLGQSGEHLAFVLGQRGRITRKGVPFLTPGGQKEDIDLIQAAELWMRFLGLDVKISVSESLGLGSIVTVNGKTLNQVGSGISQVLPVVVLCLMASQKAEFIEKKALVVLEQPELHLHPSSQALLGDLLAKFADHGVRFVVETHSEYIITRLRLLTLRKQTTAQLNLIFAESDGNQGASLTAIEVDDRGRSDYWPKGFMEQVVMDRVTLAGLQFLDED